MLLVRITIYTPLQIEHLGDIVVRVNHATCPNNDLYPVTIEHLGEIVVRVNHATC